VDDFIFRVDDRLIHGQVTAGWVRPLGIERIVLVNNEVAADEWERESYSLAVPAGVKTVILSVTEGIEFLKNTNDKKKTMVVVASLKDTVELIVGGIMIKKIHVGGLHFETGRRCIAPYICFNGTDGEFLKKIVDRGIKIEGREIPGGPSLDVWTLFERTQAG
jgi:PTS system mannose-specific IIB component